MNEDLEFIKTRLLAIASWCEAPHWTPDRKHKIIIAAAEATCAADRIQANFKRLLEGK